MTADKNMTLRVIEGNVSDVGRGIVRMSRADMDQIKVEIGDIIEISNADHLAVGKVLPSHQPDQPPQTLRMDGLLRESANVTINTSVSVARVNCTEAVKIKLEPLQVDTINDVDFLKTRFLNLPVVTGTKLRINLMVSKVYDFNVIETIPAKAVLIGSDSEIETISRFEPHPHNKPEISYEDIGGLSHEVTRVREMVELPLRYPQVFGRLGIVPPKGLLMYGPPGTGKTLLARVLAQEVNANFYLINGPEIIHKFYGESEQHLKQIFEKAQQNAPSIIFIDEIDAIAPKRVEVVGEVEKRVVATLLTELDGLKSRGKIVVIGATNIPDVLDLALRRPGRFDREVYVGIPDCSGREEILKIHTRGMPLASDVDLKHLASICHGFVGADLEVLTKEAAMACVRRSLLNTGDSLDSVSVEKLINLQVNFHDFQEAFKEAEPSALREISVEVPKVSWPDVGGHDKVKEILEETAQWPLLYSDLFQQAKIDPPRGILLHGPPGTGKTLLAKALANQCGVNFISVRGPDLMNKYVGEAEKKVRELFKRAKSAAPCIIFIDEIDSLVPKRESTQGDSGVTQRVISQFLIEMDGIEEMNGVLVLAATNRKDRIDSAILRTGRFDFILEVAHPNKKDLLQIFNIHTRKMPLNNNVNFSELISNIDHLTGSDVQAISRRAGIIAIRNYLQKKKRNKNNPTKKLDVTQSHFKQAINDIGRGINT